MGILGTSSKMGVPEAIGHFGIGFYSTQAICRNVVVLSAYGDGVIAWRYEPHHKKFTELDQDEPQHCLPKMISKNIPC